jgi:hypothetical protein
LVSAVAGHEVPDEGADPVPVLPGGVGATRVEPFVGGDEVGSVLPERRQIVLADAGAEVEQHRRDRRRVGVDRAPGHGVELGWGVGEPGEDRADEDAAADPGLVEASHRVEASRRMGGPGLGEAPDVLVEGADREAQRDLGVAGGVGEEVPVPQDEGALGEDRERVAGLGEDLDDAPGEVVLAWGGRATSISNRMGESALGLVALAGCLLARIIVVARVQLRPSRDRARRGE